jgi:type VI secretion system protein ImpA
VADTVLLDLEALLAPIAGDSPVGQNLNHSQLYDKINELRTTDDPGGAVNEAVGRLREGQARVADWPKVISVCVDTLANKTKDLTMVVYLSEALVREHGLPAIHESIELLIGVQDRYWPDFYPQIVDNDLEPRAMWLERFDRLLQKTLADFELALPMDGQVYPFWKWAHAQHLGESASKLSGDEKSNAVAEAEESKRNLESAVAKTPRKFYDDLRDASIRAEASLEALRELVEEKFKAEPGVGQLDDPIPNFGALRKGLEEVRYKIEDLLKTKPAPAPKDAEGDESAAQSPGAVGSTDGNSGISAGAIANRAQALRRLNEIAAFFQRTEPHSPISYLVQRAARWGELSLDNWLLEVLGDDVGLAKIRETLGIRPEE